MDDNNINSTIYGPVRSWRFGMSLGVDLLFQTSICSFNCVYCQLGDIQKKTSQRDIYVPTKKVLADFQEFLDQGIDCDVITFSGNGEPTLALNLGEIAGQIKKALPGKPIHILTNATMLSDLAVQKDLQQMDHVAIKLDGYDDHTLQVMNRPVEGISFEGIMDSIKSFRRSYHGILEVQMMWMPANIQYAGKYINHLKTIQPDTVQLNTPLRPYPLLSDKKNRGNHHPERDYPIRKLATISKEQADNLEKQIQEALGDSVQIISVYRS